MELKDFQQSALDTLAAYLERARISNNPEQAFIQTLREQKPDENPPPYRTIQNLWGVPNVCFRLPTGGGKTLLAAYSIAVAGRSFLERDYPVVLWLVPTSTIRKQTAEALKKTSHPYRAAIDDAFDGRVSVFDISEIDQIRPQDLIERVSVIVATIQSLRTSNPDGRKAYAHSENFEPHFAHIPDNTAGLDRGEDGKIKFSFVNLMAFHRPLVIVDEAHKAGTNLSFDMLAALRPSCIVEFTATPNFDPKNGSNVLFRASAAEVKAAQMIKLPIILTEHPDWRAAVHDAIETRARLAETAKTDPRYIRPLTLFQAQDKGQEVTVAVLKTYLIDNENIAPENIAVATGEQRELDTINLFDPACPIEFIITVEALKEGWDCSFAYVLCSVANIASATDIEQLLGRILRMPYAQTRPNEALNRAYTHVSSPRFGEGARALTDTLVQKMGFEPDEAAAAIETRQQYSFEGFEATGDLFHHVPVLIETLDLAPDLSGLAPDVVERVQVEAREDGRFTVTASGDIPEDLENRLIAAVPAERHEALRASVNRHRVTHRNSISPVMRGEKFAVPRLFLNVQGELELADEEFILDLGNWTLNTCAAELIPAEFSIKETSQRWEVDLQEEKVVYHALDQNVQLELGALKLDWTDLTLSRWLDKQCRQPDITQPVLLEFCRKLVATLIEQRNIPLHDLLRFKYQLAKVTLRKILAYRRQAYARDYQTFLFTPNSEVSVETSFADGFAFDKRPYPAAWSYSGRYKFKKHFLGNVGELKSAGEEFDCAQLIDNLPQVKYWIRNLSGRPKTSFWLPTSTDRFYPDFVALLNDDRILVVEYKGEPYVTNDDSKEKKNIGELWAAKSDSKGVFLLAEKKNAKGESLAEQLTYAIA
jgi:type III restriction enzyme